MDLHDGHRAFTVVKAVLGVTFSIYFGAPQKLSPEPKQAA
jgi:hypothetical protein